MRKQTKIAAIVSAAALLAIGTSMSAFAATGWQEENGTWVYYNKSGERVADSWEKSGDNWFYLDDVGEMVTDSLIEDDNNYYYVDVNGAMVRNQWVAIDNEDASEEDQPDVWWYYFQANGKAYKNNHSSGKIFKKVINGKTYCFDEDGKMQYGWVRDDDGKTDYDDAAYTTCDYYFGNENDGAMSTGWREIALTDVADAENDQPGDSFWDEDQVRWFWFKSSGKKQTSKDNKTINGKKYGFDEQGRMIADWFTEATPDNGYFEKGSTASNADKKKYAKTFMYFSSPEDGARYTKGWFKVVPGYFLNSEDYNDAENHWYYADGKGRLYAGQIKSIKGKKYAFDLDGSMISGLAVLKVADNEISEYMDTDDYDTEDKFNTVASSIINSSNYGVYYFGDDEDHDGAMKTGNQKVKIDGETFTFKFDKAGSDKGVGLNGENEKKYYLGGKLLTADSDSKIEILNIDKADPANYLKKISVTQFVANYCTKDTVPQGKAKKNGTSYTPNPGVDAKFVVINTSGSVLKSGTKKDGDGLQVVVTSNKISYIYED